MLFSVIIPTYNRLRLLREALESVWAQTFKDFEVIVVDDGSTDGTHEWLSTLGSKVVSFWQANHGPGAARNLGAMHATGEYLAFLDSDDLWPAWTLEVYRQAIQKFGCPSLIMGHSVPYAKRFEIGGTPPGIGFRGFSNLLAAWESGHGFKGTPGMAVRTAEMRSVGGFVADFVNGEDQDLCLRLGASPIAVQILSPAIFLHRAHDGHVSGDIKRSVAGVNLLLARERQGVYPGGSASRPFRRRILCALARNVSLKCIECGEFRSAVRMYFQALRWQMAIGRWKYSLGFPLAVLKGFLGRPAARPCGKAI